MSSKNTSTDYNSYVQVDVQWVVGGTEAHALSIRKPNHSNDRFAYDARLALDMAGRKIPDALAEEIEQPEGKEAPTPAPTAVEVLVDGDGYPMEDIGPKNVFTIDELRRYYAVQATGGVHDATIHSGDNTIAVARWILGGDDAL